MFRGPAGVVLSCGLSRILPLRIAQAGPTSGVLGGQDLDPPNGVGGGGAHDENAIWKMRLFFVLMGLRVTLRPMASN